MKENNVRFRATMDFLRVPEVPVSALDIKWEKHPEGVTVTFCDGADLPIELEMWFKNDRDAITIFEAAIDTVRRARQESYGAHEVVELPPNITANCSLCGLSVSTLTAHRHQGEWIGDECCWDERLRSSE